MSFVVGRVLFANYGSLLVVVLLSLVLVVVLLCAVRCYWFGRLLLSVPHVCRDVLMAVTC